MIQWIKNNLVLAVVIAIVFGTVALVGGIKFADTPFFCGMLCHEMQPHVDTLAANFHGKKEVICMDCHSEQGFINHLIEHVKASALAGAHFSKVYMEDEYDFHKGVKEFDKHKMEFLHKGIDTPEGQENKKKCLECHPDRIVESYFMIVPEHKYKMMTEQCVRCHEEVEASKTDAETAKGVLNDFSKPRKINNVHPIHLAKEVFCTKCHSRVVHSTKPEIHTPGMEMCFRCHNTGGKAPEVDCKGCHIGQVNLFAGTNGKDVSETASIMAEVGCTDCHSNNMKFNIQTCIDCHDDSYKDSINGWKDSYKAKYENAKKLHDEIKQALESGKSLGGAEEAFNKGDFNFKYAENDGSKGVHNPDFTDALLDKALAQLEEAKKAIQ